MYEKTDIPLQEFYDNMMQIFARLLKPDGTVILLTAKKEELLLAAEKANAFTLHKTIPILLSGKKAVICKLTREDPRMTSSALAPFNHSYRKATRRAHYTD
jgi:hypothetical protein